MDQEQHEPEQDPERAAARQRVLVWLCVISAAALVVTVAASLVGAQPCSQGTAEQMQACRSMATFWTRLGSLAGMALAGIGVLVLMRAGRALSRQPIDAQVEESSAQQRLL